MSEKEKSKDATLELNLSADSGYTSSESVRISSDQWRRINEIINENDGE